MSWFLFALLGYLLYALVAISNKFLLRQRATTKPLVFTFWVCAFSLLTFVLAPFGLHWPGWSWLAFDLLTGLIFFVSLLFFYKVLDVNEASRSVSLLGGLTPIVILILSYFFLGEVLNHFQLWAFILLVAGGFLISLEKIKHGFREGIKGLNFLFLTIFLHAIYFVMLKYLFDYQDFITGFVWSRMGLVLGALVLLVYGPWRREIINSMHQATAKVGSLMVGSKIAAGFGSLFISLAIFQGNVALVNALKGSEYVFLFFLTVLLSRKFPNILHEKFSQGIILQKITAIILICAGLALIAW
ncbi:EamA family transporter [Patescibacteria group bacterium]|nr:EamA family transporter [Patescibacteria group bacterium]